MKILPVGAEWFHVDGQTYMTRLVVAFPNTAYAPKNVFLLLIVIPANRNLRTSPGFVDIQEESL